MMQFKNKKVIIILVTSLLLLGIIIFFLVAKTTPSNKMENINTVTKTTINQKRMMTDAEKETVGIPKNQEAEVLNDETGFFIYNVIK